MIVISAVAGVMMTQESRNTGMTVQDSCNSCCWGCDGCNCCCWEQIKNMILTSRADELGNATQENSEMNERLEGIHGVMRGFVIVSVVKHTTQEDTE